LGEAARVFVERHQVGFVVDVQPLAAGRRDLLDEKTDEGARDAAPLVGGVDDGVEEEGVEAAVQQACTNPTSASPRKAPAHARLCRSRRTDHGCGPCPGLPNALACRSQSASSSTGNRTTMSMWSKTAAVMHRE